MVPLGTLGRLRALGLLMLAVAAVMESAGCGQSGQPVPVPSPVAPPTTTDAATGTLKVSGSSYYQFQVKATGESEVDVTLTALTTVPVTADPNANPPVAAVPAVPVSTPVTLTVGQPSITTLGVSCTSIKTVTTAVGSTPQLTGQALPGNFCILIADPSGQLAQDVLYTVLIAHS